MAEGEETTVVEITPGGVGPPCDPHASAGVARARVVVRSAEPPSRLVWQAALYLLAIVALYFSYLGYLWDVWTSVPEYTHAVLLPLFSGFMLWERRETLRARGAPSFWTVPLVFCGSLTFLAGTLLDERLTTGLSLLLVCLGVLLGLGGVPLFRAAWFPVAFLGFGVPLPDGLLIATLGDPLRDQAARWSAWLLQSLGYAVFLNGTLLHLPRITLEVAYECSGVRGLIAAMPLAAAVAYALHRSSWERTVLLLAAVPIGLTSNVLRVVAIGIRVYDFPGAPTPAELHGPTGWIPTLVALPSLLVVSGLLQWADRCVHSGSR